MSKHRYTIANPAPTSILDVNLDHDHDQNLSATISILDETTSVSNIISSRTSKFLEIDRTKHKLNNQSRIMPRIHGSGPPSDTTTNTLHSSTSAWTVCTWSAFDHSLLEGFTHTSGASTHTSRASTTSAATNVTKTTNRTASTDEWSNMSKMSGKGEDQATNHYYDVFGYPKKRALCYFSSYVYAVLGGAAVVAIAVICLMVYGHDILDALFGTERYNPRSTS